MNGQNISMPGSKSATVAASPLDCTRQRGARISAAVPRKRARHSGLPG
jgi:hypothetical protein